LLHTLLSLERYTTIYCGQCSQSESAQNIAGRIDHMAVDLVRQRLLVAELSNGAVGLAFGSQFGCIRTPGPKPS